MKKSFKTIYNETSRLPLIIVAIALLLIGVLTFNFIMYRPVVAKAAPLKTYISDVRILTCTEAQFNDESRKLKKEGYTIDKNYNFADMQEGEDVYADMNKERAYLAYKTTNDYRNAITDLAFMNMKGPYSFSDYKRLVDNQKELAKDISDKLSMGLKLFRTNYENETPASLFAYKMLNYFKEDDSGKLMGDFLLSVEFNSQALSDVILQVSTVTLNLINCLVAIGCSTVAGQDDWVTKLTNLTEDDLEKAKEVPENVKGAETLLKTIQNSNKDYSQYDRYYKELKENFGSDGFDDNDPEQVALHDEITKDYYLDFDKLANIEGTYEVLGAIPYSDSRFTYSPFGEFAGEHAGKGALIGLFLNCFDLDYEDLCGMASVFSEEQIAMIYLKGLDQFITSASNSEKVWADLEMQMKKIVKYDYTNPDKTAPTASVYMGVDRSLYSNTEGIALTDEAARRQFVDSEDMWYKGNIPNEAEIALYIIGGISAAVMLGGAAYTIAKTGKLFASYTTLASSAGTKAAKAIAQGEKTLSGFALKTGGGKIKFIENKAISSFRGTMKSIFQGDMKICFANRIGGAIFTGGLFVLMLAVTVYLLVEYFMSQEKNYTTIPNIIVNNFSVEEKVIEVVDGKDKLVSRLKSVYAKYSAVKNQNGEFADVNVGGKEWIVPYVSKDPYAGDPILAQFALARSSGSLQSGYSPMHRIGENDLYNGHYNSSLKPLYVSYKRDANAYPKTASSFSVGAFTLALCGGILGGGILGWLATYLIIKKKRKSNLLAVSAQTNGEKE